MTSAVLDLKRLALVKDIPLTVGSHPVPHGDKPPCGFCIMEKWTYVTGQPWTDSPDNCCATIAAVLRRLNDRCSQETRNALDGWIFDHADQVAATANDDKQEARRWFTTDYAVRVALPETLDALGHAEKATTLRGLREVTDASTARAATRALREMRAEFPDYWERRRQIKEAVRREVLKRLADADVDAAVVAVADVAESAVRLVEALVNT